MERDEYLKKTLSSESVIHERENKISDSKQPEGYQPHPNESRLSEVFGLKSAFDNLSVGMDEKGIISVTATSQKDYHGPTLNSDRKLMKGTRRRTLYEHFGELYTNPSAPKNSAFTFRSRRTLSENRILSELRRASDKRLSPVQRQMIPFLTIEEDREHLSELRSAQQDTAQERAEKGRLEASIAQKTSMENRFLRKLRNARLQLFPKAEEAPVQGFLTSVVSELSDGTQDEGEEDMTNIPETDDEQTQEQ